MFVRNPYNYDVDAASDESGLRCQDVSLTKQAFAEEVDINTIVKRFSLTGQLPENVRPPTYADFDEVLDFQTAMQAVSQAQGAFMEMPAEVRARFNNDPASFVDFCSNPANLAEMRSIGLAVPEAILSPGSGDGVGEHSSFT